jgi:Uma2 family endonuclease
MTARPTPPVPTRGIRRVEYDHLVECGLFSPDDRIELIDGLLVFREPQSSPHMVAVQLVHAALQRAFGPGWNVRQSGPVALDEDSEPEPDIAVVPGSPRDYVTGHPAQPVLVVEVSLSRLRFDREYKGSLYARAGVTDYWIVNLVDSVLEVRREPVLDGAAAHGWRYASLTILRAGEILRPLAMPSAAVPVGELIP